MLKNYENAPRHLGFGKRLLTTQEAAKYLGLKAQTLYNWRHVRKGPDYVLIGAAPRYELDILDKFIESNRVKLSA